MNAVNTKRIASLAVLIAIEIVLSRFCSISTPIAKIGFAFLPLALAAILYGPLYGGIVGAVADFFGAILFPIGAYFPGFTLTAFLSGFTYGVFLHEKQKTLFRITCCVLAVQLVLHLGLNTVWLWMITGKGYLAILPTRVVQTCVMIPIQLMGIYLAGKKVPALLFPKAGA